MCFAGRTNSGHPSDSLTNPFPCQEMFVSYMNTHTCVYICIYIYMYTFFAGPLAPREEISQGYLEGCLSPTFGWCNALEVALGCVFNSV